MDESGEKNRRGYCQQNIYIAHCVHKLSNIYRDKKYLAKRDEKKHTENWRMNEGTRRGKRKESKQIDVTKNKF